MLNARAIAIEGFSFSPITIAVQGLIAQLEEEQQRSGGGGGRARGGRVTALSFGKLKAYAKRESEADLIRKVEAKYEAIEKAQQRDAEAKAEARKEPGPADKIEAVTLIPVESPFEAQAKVRRQVAIEDEQIMALVCHMMLED